MYSNYFTEIIPYAGYDIKADCIGTNVWHAATDT